jgi:hypothetical protein
MSNGAFSKIHEGLDMRAAVLKASQPSDLLPPRFEDKVAGEVGRRFSDSLLHGMETGSYEPFKAYFIPVPKAGFTTRVAALLTLQDRAVYQALVDALRERIGQVVVNDRVVFGPRPVGLARPWSEFERAPLEGSPSHIVRADVAGFYEELPHEELVSALIEATGRREICDALGQFLDRIMDDRRGIPQGALASDILATLYLTPLDREMVRQGWRYFRRGDDTRVSVDSFSDGRAAVAVIEAELRKLKLRLNPTKSLVLRVGTYSKRIVAVETAREEFGHRIGEERIARIYEMDDEEIQEVAEEAGLEEIEWDLYGGGTTIEDIVELLRPHLEPDDADVAQAVFVDTMAHAPWNDRSVNREVFHQRLTWSLTVLTAARSDAALDEVGNLLFRLPDETEAVANYCAALASTSAEKHMVEVVEGFLIPDTFRHGWQEGWLFQILQNSAPALTEEFVSHLRTVADREGGEWFARIQAAKLLARRGQLDRDLLDRLWQLAPPAFRPDFIAAANEMTAFSGWAVGFLEGSGGNPVYEVVMSHVTRRRPSS